MMSNDQTRDCQKRLSLGQTPNDNVIGIEGGCKQLRETTDMPCLTEVKCRYEAGQLSIKC